jgi:branched-chain amino acid transport system ATP-binding protein
VLSIDCVSLSFGGVTALSEVSAGVRQGEIVGVIGPNGAGKTTLLNVVSGIIRPDEGKITLNGAVITGRKPSEIARMGLGRTFQTPQLFRGMSVLENMITGLHLSGSSGLLGVAFRTAKMRREEAEMRAQALQALNFVGLAHYADRMGNALSFGEQRIIEIARAVINQPTALLLDEPAVGLSVTRVAEMDRLLRRIRDERGVTVLMVEHVIRLVMEVSDRILVLNSGRKIAEGRPQEVRNNPEVVEAYLGRPRYAPR